MTAMTYRQTVYVVGGDKAVSHSLRFLLETHQFVVKAVSNIDQFVSQTKLSEQDIILLDVDDTEPRIFRMLNELLFAVKRPNIILTSTMESVLRENTP